MANSAVFRLMLVSVLISVAGDMVHHVAATMTPAATAWPITGSSVSSWVLNSIPRRRDILEINNLPTSDRYRTLYLLAMQEMQTTSDVTGDVYNHDAIAKIHGQSTPYQAACNPACAANTIAGCPAGTGRCSLSSGYCPHTNPMFAAWHRPYLSQFEMALVNAAHAVAMRVGDAGERSLYQQVAHQIRTPYIVPQASYISSPSFTILDAATVAVIDPATNMTTTITNPLASWSGSARSATWRANLAANAASWSSQISAFVTSPDWGCTWGAGFCSTGATRLESTHGSMHVNIGGGMGSVSTAARDPIFMMLHGYIDRVLQSWQGSGGSSSANWMQPPVSTAGATFFYPSGTPISSSSLLAPFYTSGWGGYWMDGSFARIQHANPWIALPYRYFTRWWWVSGITLVSKAADAPISRLVARELVDELTEEYSGYRLQVGLDNIDVNSVPVERSPATDGGAAGFCLHFMTDYQGVTGKAFADRYQEESDGTYIVAVEKMQQGAQYCGSWCSLGSSADTKEPLLVDATADITSCIVKQKLSLESSGRRNEPYLAPNSPYKLSNIYILPTNITWGGSAVNWSQLVSLKTRTELRWSNFPLVKVRKAVETVQTPEESIKTKKPTRFVPETVEDDIPLPGYAQGVLEQSEQAKP